ncbi:hypothetical protein AB5I41_10325 [Sphingomonas sp. MMS24-JH45]
MVERSDEGVAGCFTVAAGERCIVAIVAGEEEPLVVPPMADIDARIDVSDREWRDWAERVVHAGERRADFVRSALALKLLLYSPSGAIAAAGTTSLPERAGGCRASTIATPGCATQVTSSRRFSPRVRRPRPRRR